MLYIIIIINILCVLDVLMTEPDNERFFLAAVGIIFDVVVVLDKFNEIY